MFAFFFVVFFRLALPSHEYFDDDSPSRPERFPLLHRHIHKSAGHGGGESSRCAQSFVLIKVKPGTYLQTGYR
jgi:hypothetical protein